MKKLITGILAVLLVACFAVMALGSSQSDSGSEKKTEESSGTSDSGSDSSGSGTDSADNVYNLGDTLDAGGLKITFEKSEKWVSDNEFIQPKDGNIYIRAYFSIKNESGQDKSVGSVEFDCYADGEACESSYLGDDELTSLTTLSDGRSTKGYVYFEVPEAAKDIEIEYETSWWTSKKAIFKVEL